MTIFKETLYADHGQFLSIGEVLYSGHTGHQEALIFTNPVFGKVFALDGAVQLTEHDNHIYHEMISHVPLMAHGSVKDVLVIGGGDGGALKEILKHPLESVVMVELDAEVIALSRRFLPAVSGNAFDDPRVSVVIGDGAAYVAQSSRSYDAIIVDSTDPVGPGEALFVDGFYRDCRSILRPEGIIGVQTGAPFYHRQRLDRTLERLTRGFGAAKPYLAPVPTYAHGMLALAVAADSDRFCPSLETLRDRFRFDARHYSPEVHHASFALRPTFAQSPDTVVDGAAASPGGLSG